MSLEHYGVISYDIKKDFWPPGQKSSVNKKCGRWDLNPHERNAHKILSLARLPVPTLPHITFHRDSFALPRDK